MEKEGSDITRCPFLKSLKKVTPKNEVAKRLNDKYEQKGGELHPLSNCLQMVNRALNVENEETILEMLNSKEFTELHEKNKFHIYFYIILDIAYRHKSKDFFDNLDIDNPLSVFNLFDKVDIVENLDTLTIAKLNEITVQIWDSFIKNNSNYNKLLNCCLSFYFDLAKKWSTFEITDDYMQIFNGEVSIIEKEIDEKSFFMRLYFAGSGTMFTMCKKTIDALNNIKEVNLTNENKYNIAIKTINYLFRTVATQMPVAWVENIINESNYFLLSREANTGELIISSSELETIIDDSFFSQVKELASLLLLTEDEYNLTTGHLTILSGCPAAYHKIFIQVAQTLFKKAFLG